MSAHWGMSDVDGSMSTFVLSSQVSQRLKSSGVNGLTRSALLTQLAGQLKQFHNIQLSWDEQWHASRDAVAKSFGEIHLRDVDMEKMKAETKAIERAHQDRLADICREMCGGIDEHKLQEHEWDNDLGRSQHRLGEQRALMHQLEDQCLGLKRSLEMTHQKFNEVNQKYERTRGVFNRDRDVVATIDPITGRRLAPTAGWGPSAMPNSSMELVGAQTRADSLASELAEDRADLADLKTHLSRLKAELSNESSHTSHLEDFVRGIAEGPSASVRRGGGFALDSTAKREAIGLLKEADELGADTRALAAPVMPGARSQLLF